MSVRKLKGQLFAASCAVLLSVFTLAASTYAWYVTNNTVKATTTTISASTNGFVLQIATLEEGAQHGGEQKSLEAFTSGSTLSPASSDDFENWYVCRSWNNDGNVTSYEIPSFETGEDAKPGNYKVSGNDYYAFIRSDYIVYTITSTGKADVYLDASDGTPISITAEGGTGAVTVMDSMRVAITTQEIDVEGNPVGNETLKVVYANKNETGKGNDSTAKNGWTSIQKDGASSKLDTVTYPYIYNGHYTDLSSNNWVATKVGNNFSVEDGTLPIATNVGYDGIVVHVYIWMEGTDADCINGKSVEDDPCTYNVATKFAGVATH